jgi:hypothetical protein
LPGFRRYWRRAMPARISAAGFSCPGRGRLLCVLGRGGTAIDEPAWRFVDRRRLAALQRAAGAPGFRTTAHFQPDASPRSRPARSVREIDGSNPFLRSAAFVWRRLAAPRARLSPSAGPATKQSRGEFTPGGVTARAQAAALQITGLGSTLPEHACRRPQCLQPPTSSCFPVDASDLPIGSRGALAQRDCCGMIGSSGTPATARKG